MTNSNLLRLVRTSNLRTSSTPRKRRDVRWTPASLVLTVFALLLFAGCETSNYDPLIVKNKLKELEAKIDAVGGGAAPAAAEIPADVAERLKKLEAEVKQLKEQNKKLESQISASLRAAETQAAQAVSTLGGVLTADPQSGRIVSADLTQASNLN